SVFPTTAFASLGRFQHLYRTFRPNRPMSEQSAAEMKTHITNAKLSQQIGDDVIVISCVERDLAVSAACGQCAHNIQVLIAINRSNFNSRNVFNLEKFAPEFVRKQTTADRRL